jgi:hypothetical protein
LQPDAFPIETAQIGASSVIKYNGSLHRPVTWVVNRLLLVWSNSPFTVATNVVVNDNSIAKCGTTVVIQKSTFFDGTYYAVPGSAEASYVAYDGCNVSIQLEKIVAET